MFYVQQKSYDCYGWTFLVTSESETLAEVTDVYDALVAFWEPCGEDAPKFRIVKLEVVK